MECIVTIGKRKIEIVGDKKIIANASDEAKSFTECIQKTSFSVVLKDIARNLESDENEE